MDLRMSAAAAMSAAALMTIRTIQSITRWPSILYEAVPAGRVTAAGRVDDGRRSPPG